MFIDKTKKSTIGNMNVPHLHGHTKVTLTDIKTGEIEVYEKDNMVTDAVENLYSKNLYGVMDYRDLKPVRDLFGGVMLFDNEMDTDSITPERTPRVVANAGQVAHASASTKRGNPNNASGGSQELANGYKFVWDWATNQGNGTINSMSLCHKNCGDVSISPDVFVSDIPLIKFSSSKLLMTASGNTQTRVAHTQRPLDLFYLNPTGDWGYHSAGTIITKVSTQAIEQKINGDLGASSFGESKEFSIPNFTVYRDSVTYDVENDKILFITFPSDSSVVVYSVDFDEETMTTTTFDQGITIYRETTPVLADVSTQQIVSCNKFIKSGKYIYVPSNGGSFYRLNMTNTSDIVELTSNMTDTLNFVGLGQVNINEGVVLGYNYIIANDVVCQIETPTYLGVIMEGNNRSYEVIRVARSESVDVANMVWCSSQTSGTATVNLYVGVALILPYLATIQQDFANPIIKTSDKTMKVEYTITNSN